jgi:hypothetical protein
LAVDSWQLINTVGFLSGEGPNRDSISASCWPGSTSWSSASDEKRRVVAKSVDFNPHSVNGRKLSLRAIDARGRFFLVSDGESHKSCKQNVMKLRMFLPGGLSSHPGLFRVQREGLASEL